MSAEQVALIPYCAECGGAWRPDDDDRWRAYLDTDDELVFYCKVCAERERGIGEDEEVIVHWIKRESQGASHGSSREDHGRAERLDLPEAAPAALNQQHGKSANEASDRPGTSLGHRHGTLVA